MQGQPVRSPGRVECAQLEGRLREICEGSAKLPLEKINAYRQLWGLPPLTETERKPSKQRVRRRQRQRKARASRKSVLGAPVPTTSARLRLFGMCRFDDDAEVTLIHNPNDEGGRTAEFRAFGPGTGRSPGSIPDDERVWMPGDCVRSWSIEMAGSENANGHCPTPPLHLILVHASVEGEIHPRVAADVQNCESYLVAYDRGSPVGVALSYSQSCEEFGFGTSSVSLKWLQFEDLELGGARYAVEIRNRTTLEMYDDDRRASLFTKRRNESDEWEREAVPPQLQPTDANVRHQQRPTEGRRCGGCGGGKPATNQTKFPFRGGVRPKKDGPGSVLKRQLAEFGIETTATCPCSKTAKLMDQRGCDWCRRNIEELADSMILQRQSRGISLSQFAKLTSWAIKHRHLLQGASEMAVAKALIEHAISIAEEQETLQKVTPTPFSDEITRNLIYHIYPIEHNDRWKWNVEQLMLRIDLFNGKKAIGINLDRKTATEDQVRSFLGSEFEYVFQRNTKAGEMTTFLPLLQLVESSNPNEITFRGHAKGVSHNGRRHAHIPEWTQLLYEANLDHIELVEKQLESAAMTGACRRIHRLGRGLWFYAGSFYWFRNHWGFARDWRNVQRDVRWGAENWPGIMFGISETDYIGVDNAPHPYSKSSWQKIDRAYRRWKASYEN